MKGTSNWRCLRFLIFVLILIAWSCFQKKVAKQENNKLSAVQMLEKTFERKADLKEKELELKKLELELQARKMDQEEAVRKQEQEQKKTDWSWSWRSNGQC